MQKAVPIFAIFLVSFMMVRGQGDDSLTSLINQVFVPGAGGAGSGTGTAGTGGTGGTGGATDNENCECIPYYLCQNNTINTDGEGLIDIRIRGEDCGNYLLTCCAPPDRVEEPITRRPTVENPSGCGYRNPDGVGFRITGNVDESHFGEFPWMVAVLREEVIESKTLNVYQCGGALIHPRVVVTAAHCVADKSKHKSLKIRAGEWDTQTKDEIFMHQDRDVESVSIHEQYYAGALFNDIALLILREPVEIAENVNVLCLPRQDEVVETGNCVASGWGKNNFGAEGRYQVILKRVDLPIVPRAKCQEQLRKTRLGKYFELHRSFICAGGIAGKDTCKGDGGSPLVCPIPGQTNRYFHAGIVAWGIECGGSQVPGVYVNVPLFRDWIDEKMVFYQLDRKAYSF